jgi:drug/metabolite transporter (DMT)-like permease
MGTGDAWAPLAAVDDGTVLSSTSASTSPPSSASMASTPTRSPSPTLLEVDLSMVLPPPPSSAAPALLGPPRSAAVAPPATALLASLAGNGRLLLCCAGWYACSSVTSTLNKAILNEFPRPVTVTLVSFLLTVVVGLAFGAALPFAQPQRPTARLVRILLPYSACRVASHSAASLALSLMPVSLMHTVKAIGPLFTVALSRLFLGARVSPRVLLSLVPICGGILLACASDVEFRLGGAVAAVFSVLALAFQAILSKGIFVHSDLTEFSLLFYSSLTSAVLLAPLWFMTEGHALWSAAAAAAATAPTAAAVAASAGLTPPVLGNLLAAGVAQYLHGIFAYMVVAEASALTYSIASVVKRVVVIGVSVVWLGNRVSPLGLLGAAITFAGVLYYNEAVRRSHRSGSSHAADGQRNDGGQAPLPLRGRGLGLGSPPLLPVYTKATARSNDRAAGLAAHQRHHVYASSVGAGIGAEHRRRRLVLEPHHEDDLVASDSGLELADTRYLV